MKPSLNKIPLVIYYKGKEYKPLLYFSYWKMFRGLMFSSPKVVLFDFSKPTRRSIHGFFCFYPIELVFLDNNLKPVESFLLRPWNVYKNKHVARYLLEIPQE